MSSLLRRLAPALLVGLTVWLTASAALAHAVVFPKQVNANTYEKFVLRVPSEKEDTPTVSVKLTVPDGIKISRVQPVPGWTYTLEKKADGSIGTITWTGGEIGPVEFMEFPFQGKTPGEPMDLVWKVTQEYGNGEKVDWAGPADSDTPASVTRVTAAPAGADAHGQQPAPAAPAPGAPAAAVPAPGAPAAGGGMTAVAAYGGLVLGAAALILSLRRRPA